MEDITLFIRNNRLEILEEVLTIKGCTISIKESKHEDFKWVTIMSKNAESLFLAGIKFGKEIAENDE